MNRLVDVGRTTRRQRSTCTELVPVDQLACPECGATIAESETLWQDTLLRGGGYGGTRRTDTIVCDCGYVRVVAVATERPPRVAVS